jgi:AraC family transcriptional regulator
MQTDTIVLEQGGSGAQPHDVDHEILSAIPASAGPRLATPRGGAFYSVRAPGAQSFVAKHHFAGIMLAPCLGVRATLGSDRVHEYDALTGQLVVNPADVDSTLEWPSQRENIVIALKKDSLRALAEDELDTGNAELEPPPFGTIDQTTLHVAQLLKAELTRPRGSNELYVDSLITMFGIHLLRNYTVQQRLVPQFRGGLTQQAERRVRDYLDENFTRKISVSELAAIAGLSPGHFIQAFTRTFGRAPHRYLVELRLEHAERLLVKGEMPIAEVAYRTAFSSQSHLTATMKKHKRITPTQLRAGK